MAEAAIHKKKLGAFYTPSNVSDLLCNWAIRSAQDLVLEPSFGGCGFLKSAVERFKQLNVLAPQERLFGCDVDPVAFNHLSNTLGELADLSNFVLGDFLTLSGKREWCGKFDVIIGNPPYLPYQKIDKEIRYSAQEYLKYSGLKLSSRASLWTYFVVLSTTFLRHGGRIAWVLPGSFLQADYARAVRSFLKRRFIHIHAFSVHERLFLQEGTDEETVVLLAEGYRDENESENNDIGFSRCLDLQALNDGIQEWKLGELQTDTVCGDAIQSAMSAGAREIWDRATVGNNVKRLGEFIDVRIGLVTGDNAFFVLDLEQLETRGIDRSELRPILSKFSYLDGLSFNDSDHENLLCRGRKGLLVNVGRSDSPSLALQEYLAEYPQSKIDGVGTFKKRSCWSEPEDWNVPPAFFPVMHHLGPRIIINNTNANCTNTLHRAYFKGEVTEVEKLALSISLLSSFSQVSAEIEGRKYGSGVLKHEPRDAEKIKIIWPLEASLSKVQTCYAKIDGALRANLPDLARELADQFVGSVQSTVSSDALKSLAHELTLIRQRRVPNRRLG